MNDNTPAPVMTDLSGAEAANTIVWKPAAAALPMRRVTRGSRVGGSVAVALGGLWCAGMGASIADALAGDALPGKLALLALFASPGVFTLLFGLGQFLYRHETVIDRTAVTVTTTGLRGRRQWREPVASYRGVLRRVHLDMPDDAQARIGSRYEFTLTLAHAERRHEILLYEASSRLPAPPAALVRQWQQYSELLGLPKLDDPAA